MRAVLLAPFALLAAAPALAQTPAASPDLSDKLKESGGVIKPKEMDPGIAKPALRTGDPNVIPPSAAKPSPTPTGETQPK